MESSKPHICLLCNRRIKKPAFSIFTEEFFEHCWVTIALAEYIFHRMFAVKVEHVHSQTNFHEKSVVLDMLCKRTIIVKKKVVWRLSIDSKCAFNKLLEKNKLLQT